jgi:hypothetical protein
VLVRRDFKYSSLVFFVLHVGWWRSLVLRGGMENGGLKGCGLMGRVFCCSLYGRRPANFHSGVQVCLLVQICACLGGSVCSGWDRPHGHYKGHYNCCSCVGQILGLEKEVTSVEHLHQRGAQLCGLCSSGLC